MRGQVLNELKELVTGKRQAKNKSDRLFLDGHSAALKLIPFYQLLLSQKHSLESLSKDGLLHLITGYAMGEMQAKDLIDTGIELSKTEH